MKKIKKIYVTGLLKVLLLHTFMFEKFQKVEKRLTEKFAFYLLILFGFFFYQFKLLKASEMACSYARDSEFSIHYASYRFEKQEHKGVSDRSKSHISLCKYIKNALLFSTTYAEACKIIMQSHIFRLNLRCG